MLSKASNASRVAVSHVCLEPIKLKQVLLGEKKALIEMYLIGALRKAPSPLLNIWVCTSCPAINFQLCKTLSFFMPRDPSFIHARKVSRPLGVRQERAVAVSVQLAESEDLQPAFWVRNAFRLLWSADQLYIKRRWKIILLFKYEHNRLLPLGRFYTVLSLV